MKIHLVRHARGRKRVEADSTLDALNEEGREQASALADHFSSGPPSRFVSASALRCQETVLPLARAAKRPVSRDDRLDDDASIEDLIGLITELGDLDEDADVVLCTHALPIRRLLTFLAIEDESESTETICRKGSVWTLECGSGLSLQRATYAEPSRRRSRRDGVAKIEREIVWPQSRRAAVLDMGSTSFTLLIADVSREGVLRPVARHKVMLRLGAAIARSGKVPGPLVDEAIVAARALCEIAAREKTEVFRAVATASLRDARNGGKVGEKISRAIAAPVDILPGETEARLMFRAFQSRLSLGKAPVIGLDLGGGSLELAVGCGRIIDHECTMGLGVVRLNSEIVTTDPIRRREQRRLRERVEQELLPHRATLVKRGPRRMIVAGGTPRAIARQVAAERDDRDAEDGLPIDFDLETLRGLRKRLVGSTHDERLRMPGIRRQRADLVPTGAVILESVADVLGLDQFTICDWGLREGVLLELMEKTGPRAIVAS